MRAVVYRGTKNVAVEEVPDAQIQEPTDAVIRITTTNICGSDLHMYEGRAGVEEGKILGHENMGVVEEVGAGVTRVKKGDRVSVPFNIACGTCRSCNQGWTSFCERVNPVEGMQGSAYGYANMGPYDGGQAELLRVPYADFNLLELPPGTEHEHDFTMLSDIFPTGWHGVVLSGFQPGDRVAVFGAGPVGLMAAHSARIMGASDVFVVDQHADRLDLVKQLDCTPIDFSVGDPADQILEATNGLGTDVGVEAVGWQAHDSTGDEHPELVLDNLVQVVKAHGGIGVVGVYVPQDPGAATEQTKEGRIPWTYGDFFTKGQRMGTGQAPVKRYNRQLRDLIIQGTATPGFLVSHEIGLDEAPTGYKNFDERNNGWTKVLLKPVSDVDTVVLDVDGTLVDTAYLHVLAWDTAFSAVGLEVPHHRIHRAIGIGGDRLVTEVAGQCVEDAVGDDVRARHDEAFEARLHDVHALPGATELLAELRRRGLQVVVATSGPPEQTDRLLQLVDGDRHLDARATTDDAAASKPAPDIIDAALERVAGDRAVVIGDAVWDARAAKQRGHHVIGLLTGGFSAAELTEAGADQVFASPQELLDRLETTPLW